MNKKIVFNWVRWIVLVLVIIGGMVALVYYQKSQPQPGQALADQGHEHVSKAEVEAFSYNSNPPTSGPHFAKVPPFGIYDQELHPGYQIHMLEHGGILIQYNTQDSALIEELRAQARRLADIDPRVALAPNTTMDSPIALTAWNHLLTLNELNEEEMNAFFSAYVNKGPEKVSSKVHQDMVPVDAPTPIELFE